MLSFVQSISPLHCVGEIEVAQTRNVICQSHGTLRCSLETLERSLDETHPHYMRHFFEKDAVLGLNLLESFLHKSILLRFRLQMRSSTWAFVIDVAFHVLKLCCGQKMRLIRKELRYTSREFRDKLCLTFCLWRS